MTTLSWISARYSLKRRIINALLLRELMQRYGHGNLGFLWLVLEPLALSVGVMVIWSATYGTTKHGVNVIPFVLTGYSVLTFWRHAVTRSIHCFQSTAELLFHRQIQPIDVFVARMVLETFGILISFFSAYLPLLLVGFIEPIDDSLLLLGGWMLLAFFNVGIGLIVASLTELSDAVERLIGPFMYVTIPATGAFFLMAWLPSEAQDVLWWSPLIHASEMIRAGYFGPGIPTTYDIGYLLVSGVVVNAIGWAMVYRAAHSIELP